MRSLGEQFGLIHSITNHVDFGEFKRIKELTFISVLEDEVRPPAQRTHETVTFRSIFQPFIINATFYHQICNFSDFREHGFNFSC